MSDISDSDLTHIFRCVENKFVSEVRGFKNAKETAIDEEDTPILYAITNLASTLLIYNKARVSIYGQHISPILMLLVDLVSNREIETGNSYVSLAIDTFRHFSTAMQGRLVI